LILQSDGLEYNRGCIRESNRRVRVLKCNKSFLPVHQNRVSTLQNVVHLSSATSQQLRRQGRAFLVTTLWKGRQTCTSASASDLRVPCVFLLARCFAGEGFHSGGE
jgi:hypothetical protein